MTRNEIISLKRLLKFTSNYEFDALPLSDSAMEAELGIEPRM